MSKAATDPKTTLTTGLEGLGTNPGKARKELRKLMAKMEVDPCTLSAMIRELVMDARSFEAVELASAWVEKETRSALGHLELGRALLSRAALRADADAGHRDRRAAMKVLRHAAELDPTSADTLDSLAEACASSGDPDGYVEARWKYLEAAGSQDHGSYLELGRALIEVDPQRAIECFRRAIAILPTSPEPYDDLYALLIDDGDEEAADEVLKNKLEVAVEEPEEQLEGYLELLASFSDRGVWADVVQVGTKVLEIDPESVEALIAVGNAHAEEGDYADAADYLEKALDFNPEDPDILKLLTEVKDRLE